MLLVTRALLHDLLLQNLLQTVMHYGSTLNYIRILHLCILILILIN